MTAETTLRAGCKINVFLRVTGVRDDGYHTLESLFLPLDEPFDTLTIKPAAKGSGFCFSCSDAALTNNNILQKTYTAFAKATGFVPDIDVFLEKAIPYGAGLGGGSSDAAALLTYCNSTAKREGRKFLAPHELTALAAQLGADVPFFLFRRAAIVRGIGEIIEPAVNPVAGMYLVLVCPQVHVPTAWAFNAWDRENAEKHVHSTLTNRGENDTRPLVRGICVHNDLEAVVFKRHPELGEVVTALRDHGAEAAAMSGSGASLFGLFANERKAADAAGFFRAKGERVFQHIL
ncbi:MAG: 4-diphosphocytidyl-2-C-methyl-D-erythritol kinase [Desulfovibrio sp.]